MLPLDDPRWAKLTHAYGAAIDIPPQLARLKLDIAAAGSVFLELDCLGALNHQSSISTAFYAAVPHLIDVASKLPPQDRAMILGWVGASFADVALPDAPVVPKFLLAALNKAKSQAVRLTSETLAYPFDVGTTRWLLAAMAALQGHPDLSHVVASLDCVLDCPECGAMIEPMESSLNLGFMRRGGDAGEDDEECDDD